MPKRSSAISIKLKIAISLGIFLFQLSAFAEEATTTFPVSVMVNGTCSVEATNLYFGNLATLEPANLSQTDAQSVISVTCTNGLPYSIALNYGQNGDSGSGQRQMKMGDTSINYNIYTDASRSTIWGDGSGAGEVVQGTGNGTSQDINVYGRIPGQAFTGGAGLYQDVINVTVNY